MPGSDLFYRPWRINKLTRMTLLFDLDGTLVDSLQDLTDAVNYARKHFSLTPISPAQTKNYIGDGQLNLVKRAFFDADEGLDIQQPLKILQTYYQEHLLDCTKLFPGVKETASNSRQIQAGRCYYKQAGRPPNKSVRAWATLNFLCCINRRGRPPTGKTASGTPVAGSRVMWRQTGKCLDDRRPLYRFGSSSSSRMQILLL